MPEIYLIRHGIAADRADYPQDDLRPLTERGHQKTTQVARRLREIGLEFAVILTSPLVRARQTAEILQTAGLSSRLTEFSALAPGGNLSEWVNWWSSSRYNKDRSCLALVGHQPDLGNWAEILIWGRSQAKLTVKKAGAIGLALPEEKTPIGNSELFLLVSPRWLLSE